MPQPEHLGVTLGQKSRLLQLGEQLQNRLRHEVLGRELEPAVPGGLQANVHRHFRTQGVHFPSSSSYLWGVFGGPFKAPMMKSQHSGAEFAAI